MSKQSGPLINTECAGVMDRQLHLEPVVHGKDKRSGTIAEVLVPHSIRVYVFSINL